MRLRNGVRVCGYVSTSYKTTKVTGTHNTQLVTSVNVLDMLNDHKKIYSEQIIVNSESS